MRLLHRDTDVESDERVEQDLDRDTTVDERRESPPSRSSALPTPSSDRSSGRGRS